MRTLDSRYRDIDVQINEIVIGAKYNNLGKAKIVSLLEDRFNKLLLEEDIDLFHKISYCANILHMYCRENINEEIFLSSYESFTKEMNIDSMYSLIATIDKYTDNSSIVVDFILKAEGIDNHYRKLADRNLAENFDEKILNLVH